MNITLKETYLRLHCIALFKPVKKTVKNLSKTCQKPVKNLSKTCQKPVENLSKTCRKPVENLFKNLLKTCFYISRSKHIGASCLRIVQRKVGSFAGSCSSSQHATAAGFEPQLSVRREHSISSQK